MAEQVIAEGLTALDWLMAGTVFVAGVLLGRGARWLLVRRVSRDDGEARAAVMVVGRLIGSLAVLGGLVYALTILQVRIGPLLGAIGIGGIALALAAQSLLATSSPASSSSHDGRSAAVTRSRPETRKAGSKMWTFAP